MGEKDLSEKILEDYNDVFADIMNVLLFDGKDVVKPDSLKNSSVHSQCRAEDEKLHEQERDVAKHWMDGNVELALYGIENQSSVDRYMPFRVIGYDGATYRSQLLHTEKAVVPVVTIVLYFGNDHWTAPKNVKDLLDIPAGLADYVNDYRIHVFEIAWLTDAQIAKFKSDFGVVARFFVEKRKDPFYTPQDGTAIAHVDAVLKLLSTVSKDPRYERVLHTNNEKEIKSMCDVADRLERMGIEKGIKEGRLAEIFDSVLAGDYSVKRGAEKANMEIAEFEKAMKDAGYTVAQSKQSDIFSK